MALSPGETSIPLAEAAQRLGLSSEAVRKRLERGTLQGIKRGRAWYVILPDEPSGQRPDERPNTEIAETLATLREQLSVKDQQIERQQTEVERLTVMLADAQTTIRGLLTTNVPDAPQSSVRRSEDLNSSEGDRKPNGAPGGAGEAGDPSARPRPSWWRRFFFGEG